MSDARRNELADEALLDRARAGDALAFRALVERYEPVVAATVIGMLGRGADAEDVGQETFVRLYRTLERFRGDASLGTYLTRIAMNLSLNALKRRKRLASRFRSRDREDLPPEEPRGETADPAVAADRRRRVRAAIDGLAPPYRAVVVLRLMEGFSTRETARILDVPEGTVLSRLSRARRRLREVLGPWVDDDV